MPSIFSPAHILLPGAEIPLDRWACIACDQFTSQPDYWQAVERQVEDTPSTFRMILPELYLGRPDTPQRIEAIHQAMARYAAGVLSRSVDGYLYIERTQTGGAVRAGLLGAVDLDAYSFDLAARPAVRPTESTVVSRIPPRLAVRRGALLESPHVMMLADDPEGTLVEAVGRHKAELQQVYGGDLMLGGGHIAGWAVTAPALIAQIEAALAALGSQAAFDARYPQAAGGPPLTLAVGDGNHSLATAKAYWEELRAALPPEQRAGHPARRCLAEVCNVHSPAIQIEPIHRLVTGMDAGALLDAWQCYAAARGARVTPGQPGERTVVVTGARGEQPVGLYGFAQPLAVGSVEAFLDEFLPQHPEAAVDYIHGEDTCRALARAGGVGLLLPALEKSELFRGVVLGGVLPRKTFSMGHARDKRYYLECRAIAEG